MIKLKTQTETVPLSISLMGDLLGESVTTSKRGEYKKAKTKIADMTPDEKRQYDAQKKAEARAKAAAEKKEGRVAFTGDNVREALADAALVLLHLAERVRKTLKRTCPCSLQTNLLLFSISRTKPVKVKSNHGCLKS